MVKDYFQDIIPPEEQDSQPKRHAAAAPEPAFDAQEDEEEMVPIHRAEDPAPSRGIRDIAPPRSRPRMGGMAMPPGRLPPKPRRSGSHWWMWAAAAGLVVIVIGLALFAFRSTTVTIVPTSHLVTFTNADQFTAYPAETAATGTLTYTVQTQDFQQSEDVPSTGGSTTTPPTKASGSITVYNDYSVSSQKLIANTRFETPNGVVFRTPNAIVIPGKKGSTPGSVQVTVIADQPGDQYNVGPVARFNVPGLKSSPSMYAHIYASSQSAMAGGSSGATGPAVDPAVRTKAVADLQAALLAKIQSVVSTLESQGMTVVPGIMQVTYAAAPDTQGSNGQVGINETAHAVIPAFPSQLFAQTVGSLVSADVGSSSITLIPESGFAAQLSSQSASLGANPITFTLSGQAELVWNIDTSAIAQALAGKNSGAFQTIVNGFSGIQQAHARIEPFWSNKFPSNPAAIKITVESAASSSTQ